MYVAFFTDLVSLLLLLGAFYLIWKYKKNFYSLIPLLPALALISIGRVCDMLVEHPTIHLSNLFGLSPESFELFFAVAGNAADVIGISLLIYGFIKIINYEIFREKHIENLEKLLPICSSCKKYLSEDGNWTPIEKYLIERGAPKIAQGICPECLGKLLSESQKSKH